MAALSLKMKEPQDILYQAVNLFFLFNTVESMPLKTDCYPGIAKYLEEYRPFTIRKYKWFGSL